MSSMKDGQRKKGTAKAPKGRRNARVLRRCIQAVCFAFFLLLLLSTVSPLPQSLIPVDLFLRLDPSVAAVIPLASREFIAALLPGAAILLFALAAGRFFCGYICPMGITLDIARFLGSLLTGKAAGKGEKKRDRHHDAAAGAGKDHSGMPSGLRHLKYLLLAVLAGAALFGLNLCFWLSPIPLITRFYVLLVHPLLTLAGNEALALAQPAIYAADLASLGYLQVQVRRFDSMYFLLFFFGALFVLEQTRSRFWCRYICPAGGLLGLLSFRPLWRRRVHSCAACGRCARECPTGAIHPAGRPTDHGECITCRTCGDICPVRGTVFAVGGGETEGAQTTDANAARGAFSDEDASHAHEADNEAAVLEKARHGRAAYLPSRRHFLFATGIGAGMAALGFSSLHSPMREDARGTLWSELCVRPPGAVPEPDFLARCLRCGQCMKACPTNGLQPVWFAAGVEGMFSPALISRRGPCEPDCNACGRVCPTRAIAPLPLEEKHWAKIGTAVVLQGYCLAWAENRSCVVCEEVCPYGAIKCERQAGASVSVPVVAAERCFGCGYCEQHCPVRVPAIVVRPLNALRLPGTEYKTTALGIGLSLVPGLKEPPAEQYPEAIPQDGLPPGFSD